MKTLAHAVDKQRLVIRVTILREGQPRRWGKMSCHEMLCHVNDAFLCALGEKKASSGSFPLPQRIAKWGALYFPAPWPKGIATRPEMEQGVGGTAPFEFEHDRRKLIDSMERFAITGTELARIEHPIFGKMTEKDWLRWGYLHCDHHLRQFGV